MNEEDIRVFSVLEKRKNNNPVMRYPKGMPLIYPSGLVTVPGFSKSPRMSPETEEIIIKGYYPNS